MKHNFFQKQLVFYIYINGFYLFPLMAYLIVAYHPNSPEPFSFSLFLIYALVSEAIFIIGGILAGIANRVIVDNNGISLNRIFQKNISIAWKDLGNIYMKKDIYERDIIFESMDGNKLISINLLSSKNAKMIYDICPILSIQEMIKELNIMN